ncbi:pcdc2/rp-8 [Corchorus capsularis]|uniref:Pcdc2/rp-8 n=1 Tax=Corchorus capsularis TaxID=210143 RepID=A0A1R3GK04_COCAP|nr:pcdc2/rp-8 [Corchorus capsularis]
MSRHRRQASRVLPPELTLEADAAAVPPPKSAHSAQPIASPYGRHGGCGSHGSTTTDRFAAINPSSNIHQDTSGNHSHQTAEEKPSATTKPS